MSNVLSIYNSWDFSKLIISWFIPLYDVKLIRDTSIQRACIRSYVELLNVVSPTIFNMYVFAASLARYLLSDRAEIYISILHLLSHLFCGN